jgi:N-acetylmuramoyl-L-alanine amidase
MPKLVVVDPGHGGSDPGAAAHGLKEAKVTLSLAKRLRKALVRDFDVRVELTRKSDRTVALQRRATFANDLQADYFVALHINSGGGTGYEDFVHRSAPPSGKTAKHRSALHRAVMNFMKEKGIPDRGKKSANFVVLRETAMPAVLTENLFIDNPADARLLKDSAFLNGLAAAHARGIGAALRLPRRPG